MPCAAGEHCKLRSRKPIPPPDTIHECRKCGGYLHGVCGVKDPKGGDDDCARVCEGQCKVAAQQRAGGAGNKDPGSPTPSLNSPATNSSDAPAEGGGQNPKKPSTGGKKRRNLSLATKWEVLDDLNKKLKVAVVAEKFHIATRTVRQIKADAGRITTQMESRPGAGSAKSLKGPQFPEIDRYTMELVEAARAEGLPVIRSTIQAFGAKARDAAVAKAQTDKDRAKYEGFTASIHWAKNFIVRNNLSKTRPHGIEDEGSVDATHGRQDPPPQKDVRNGTDEGGPGDGGHPAPEGEEEEEQKNAFDAEDSNNKPVADPADGPTSRPNADAKKAERGAGGGAKKAPVPPPYADVADHFGHLEATAVECAMERVSHFLRLAKMEWIDEFEKRKGRQTDIRDFFSSK